MVAAAKATKGSSPSNNANSDPNPANIDTLDNHSHHHEHHNARSSSDSTNISAGSITTKHHHPGQGSVGGKAANGLSASVSASGNGREVAGMNNLGMMVGPGGMSHGGNHGGHGGHVGHDHGMGMGGQGMGSLDDGDNRTRNAKAQRRHREKRKAHLKALEESVQVLTAQLEDARRQLGQAAYFNSTGQRAPGSGPLSPQSKDTAQLSAENTYLRDENADLRGQLYAHRSSYGHPPGPGDEVKSEQGGFAYPGQPGGPGGPGGMSPRRGRGSGEIPENSLPSTAEGSGSGSSSSGGYHPHGHGHSGHPVDFTPMHQRSRSRVMSSGSAPSASPYLAQQPDPRAMEARYSGPHMRYEAQPQGGSMYAPPQQQQQQHVPRYDVGAHGHAYVPRQDGPDGVSWPPGSGPPPFGSYPMSFQQENSSNDEWRPEH